MNFSLYCNQLIIHRVDQCQEVVDQYESGITYLDITMGGCH